MSSESKVLNPERIPMRQQLAYALSELASCPLYTIVFTFLTFFYTDVLGMNAGFPCVTHVVILRLS